MQLRSGAAPKNVVGGRSCAAHFEASGEAAKSDCATRGLSRKTFSKWRSQLNNTVSAPAFHVAVHPPEPSPTGRDMELELGNGLVLRLKRR